MFHVGQMVVCVDDRPEPSRRHLGMNGLTKGLVYTIRGIYMSRSSGDPALLLEEIVCPPERWRDGYTFERGFKSRRFRPVRKTDISVFREVVESVRNRTLVPAEITTNPARCANTVGRNHLCQNAADEPAKALPAIKFFALSLHARKGALETAACVGGDLPA